MNIHSEIDDEEKPLDPATENVRRKLARFGAIFMGLNMLALMAVLAAIVYKIGGWGEAETPVQATAPGVPLDPGFEAFIDIPDGASVISASENGGRLAVVLRLAGGGNEIWLLDLSSGEIAGKVKLR